MNFNIESYISESDMRMIAEDEFRTLVRSHLRDENNFKRILTNLAYDMVWDKVDEEASETIREFLPRKVQEIIGDMSEFSIFKKPNAWDQEVNSGYQILEKVLLENKPLITSKVVESIQSAPKKYLRSLSEKAFQDIIERAITGASK